MTRHSAVSVIIAVVAAYSMSAPAISQAGYPACQNGDIGVWASEMSPGAGHRGVELEFSLAPNHAPCTLTGYPGVDTGSGGPLLHAERALNGYLGGPSGGVATTTLGPRYGGLAVVEGVAVNDDACTLQVHPVE